jgi:uncharacterized protein (DUF1697 family)
MKLFLNYLKQSRYDFCNFINKQPWDKNLRKESENFLIAFDNSVNKIEEIKDLREKIKDSEEFCKAFDLLIKK